MDRKSSTCIPSALYRSYIGLTPSGDDFIQGILFIEGVIQAQPVIKTAVQDFLQERSTTDVSRAYYQALFKGYVNSSWIQLLQAAREEDRLSIEGLIQAIKTYGATSGSDILLGVKSYLQ